MPRLLSVGECMVELAPAREDGLFALGFAGDTFNTAWYARRLFPESWDVDYLTAVGADPLSDRMVDFFSAAGVGVAHVRRAPDRTVGLYMIELRDGERSFVYWRSDSAARGLCDDPDAARAAMRGADMIYFSGITLAILGDARPVFLDLVAEARGAGARVVFDPNLRPRLWSGAAAMREAVAEAASRADIALPSFDDEAAAFGDADPQATARRYAAAGASLVVVKNGAGAVSTLEDGAPGEHAVAPAAAVDTTAAGDSFNAGFLAALIAGASTAEAVARGARVAARVVGARGALVPLDDAEGAGS